MIYITIWYPLSLDSPLETLRDKVAIGTQKNQTLMLKNDLTGQNQLPRTQSVLKLMRNAKSSKHNVDTDVAKDILHGLACIAAYQRLKG